MKANSTKTMSETEIRNAQYVLFEDQICYDTDDYYVWGAVVYDIANDKFICPRYGHGTDLDNRDKMVGLNEAVDAGLVDIAHVIDVLVKQLGIGVQYIEDLAINHDIENPTCIPVTVTRGRKFKGAGYLIGANSERQRYGLGAYHNEWINHPIIFDPETKTINVVNSFGYLEVADDVKKQLNACVRANIANTVTEAHRIAHCFAYNMSYAHCDALNAQDLKDEYVYRITNKLPIEECVKIASEEYKAQRAADREKLKAEKMPILIQWVKDNTDKKGDEIEALAEHIFNKRY